jgi:hypothetical protein
MYANDLLKTIFFIHVKTSAWKRVQKNINYGKKGRGYFVVSYLIKINI